MEARRREHEPHEREERRERAERREGRLEPVERPEYQARVAEHPDLVHWGPVWVGLISAFGVLIFLGLLALAVGLTAAPPAGVPGAPPDATVGIVSIIAVLIAFAVGGWMAGRTSSARGRFSGIVTGTVVWALGLTLIILLSAIGLGGLLGTFAGVLGGVAPGTAIATASGAAVTALIGAFLTWIVTVAACVWGTTTIAPELEEY